MKINILNLPLWYNFCHLKHKIFKNVHIREHLCCIMLCFFYCKLLCNRMKISILFFSAILLLSIFFRDFISLFYLLLRDCLEIMDILFLLNHTGESTFYEDFSIFMILKQFLLKMLKAWKLCYLFKRLFMHFLMLFKLSMRENCKKLFKNWFSLCNWVGMRSIVRMRGWLWRSRNDNLHIYL